MGASIRFEDQVVDLARRELTRAGRAIPIEPRVFDLLVYLIENRDRVVTKDNLVADVWSGRIVSDAALTSAINAVRRAVGDSGGEQRVIRTIPKKGIRFVGTLKDEPSRKTELGVPPTWPSIAVLPFLNLSGDPNQEYLVDGIVEEIMTALARSRAVTVIARSSSFTYKGRAVDVRQVGHELGVRYVLEGSIRASGHRLRITGQLADTSSGSQVWTGRFEGTLEEMFDLQDRLASNVVVAMLPSLELVEMSRIRHKPIASLQAYDYFLQAREMSFKYTNDTNEQAISLFGKALELDPDFARAAAWMADCYKRRNEWGWSTDFDRDMREALTLSRRALALDNEDPRVLAPVGSVLVDTIVHAPEGLALLDKALELDPNLFSAWNWRGWASLILGTGDGLKYFEGALQLSPSYPTRNWLQVGVAASYLVAGNYDDAASLMEQALRVQPHQHLSLWLYAVSAALAGRIEEARDARRRMLSVAPNLRLSNAEVWMITKHKPTQEMILRGLRLAGLPD